MAGAGMMDPAQMMNMLQNPAMQQMATALMQDPQALQSLQQMMQATVGSNPGSYMQHMQQVMSNPAVLPAVMQMMQDPQMQQMMFQQMGTMASNGGMGASPMAGLGPALLGMGGFPPPAGGTPAAPPVTPTAPAVPAQPAPTPTAPPAADFNAMLTNVLTNMNAAPPAGTPAVNTGATVAPEIRYAAQISQLCDMGFFDADANLRALVATGGNVNAAVERLLSGV